MAKVRIPINPMQVGKVGAYSMYVRNGEQIVRQRKNSSNYGEEASRSYLQQVRRVMWPNLVNFYKQNSFWMKGAFETKTGSQTDYNKFMQLNMMSARVPMMKFEASTDTCIVDALTISQGSLAATNIERTGSDEWTFNLSLGSAALPANPTVGDLANAIINNNDGWQNGDNLAVICFFNRFWVGDVPRCETEYFEFTLRTNDTTPLANNRLFSEDLLVIDEGSLVVGPYIVGSGPAGIAGIHTRRDPQLKVSSQRIIMLDESRITPRLDASFLDSCIESYGLDSQVLLAPGGA